MYICVCAVSEVGTVLSLYCLGTIGMVHSCAYYTFCWCGTETADVSGAAAATVKECHKFALLPWAWFVVLMLELGSAPAHYREINIFKHY